MGVNGRIDVRWTSHLPAKRLVDTDAVIPMPGNRETTVGTVMQRPRSNSERDASHCRCFTGVPLFVFRLLPDLFTTSGVIGVPGASLAPSVPAPAEEGLGMGSRSRERGGKDTHGLKKQGSLFT